MFKEALDTYSSDCMPFAAREVPSINVARMGGRATFHIHTADDTARQVSGAGIEGPSRAARLIVERTLGAAIYPVRREIDESLRERIEKYLWSSRYEKPELEWKERYRR